MESLEKHITEIHLQEQNTSDEERMNTRCEEEKKIEQMKLQLQQENSIDQRRKPNDATSLYSKLPKSVVTKLNETYSDWLRFGVNLKLKLTKHTFLL